MPAQAERGRQSTEAVQKLPTPTEVLKDHRLKTAADVLNVLMPRAIREISVVPPGKWATARLDPENTRAFTDGIIHLRASAEYLHGDKKMDTVSVLALGGGQFVTFDIEGQLQTEK